MFCKPTLTLVAAGLLLGLVSWSCAKDEGPAPKPSPKTEPAPAATVEKVAPNESPAPAATATVATTPTVAATPTAAATTSVATSTTAVAVPPAPVAGTVPLKLKYPEIIDTTTPVPPPTGPHVMSASKSLPPILVAEGSTNLALGKPVTSSDKFVIIGDISQVTDGEKDFTAGSCLELAPGKQWVQIDLGAPSRIYAIVVWRKFNQQIAYHDVVVQVSDDADFISNVRTVFNNDYDNSSGLGVGKDLEHIEGPRGQAIDAGGVVGRYVRLYSNGNTLNDQNHYVEVEVYGVPAK
jgi:hypothetical protein